ncbi:cytochrome P450 3A4 [Dermatophagoides farinae]|uniref:Thromboxane-A synthase n=2 Tax=Dermatophagoides farinae TaxID=6954 RepID=A0A922I9A7_DERFA|nr:cytochrome P450 3A4-like [Dermatophagoides farinae]XP_046915398.1 cytochrome P450 3A4-like [Dermatophagoides farinae]KAH9526637.1 Thromboxane-A synthase [Dermatophagoides farinae]
MKMSISLFSLSLDYVSYVIGIVVIIPLLIWAIVELNEYRTKQQCKRQNLPYARVPAWNFVALFGKRFDMVISDTIRKHGKVFGFNMWNHLNISIADPELAQIVCNREFTKFANHHNMAVSDPVWDNFLFVLKDEDWKRLRAIISPTFSTGKLRKMKPCLDDTIKLMAKNLDEKILKNPAVNMKEIVGAYTMDSIIQISMGIKIDTIHDPNNLIIQNASKLFGQGMSFTELTIFALATAFPNFVKLLGFKFQAEAMKFLANISREIIQKKREEMKIRSKSQKASNFIELILEVEQEQKQVLEQSGKPFKYVNNDELIAQCITFFTAGYDTTSSAILFAIYLLASNPDKQEKLHQSIIDTIEKLAKQRDGDCDDPYELITFDSLNNFEYLNAVLNESMRSLTLVFVIDRVAVEDVRLETSDKKIWFDVRKGDIIRIPPIDLHNDPENFCDPEKFIPERFLAENTAKPFNKMAFMPFGSGPRKCVATSLALLEAKMALLHLFRMYRFSLDPKTKLDYNVILDSLIPKDIILRVDKR